MTKKLMCPYLFTSKDEPEVLWIFSLDARNRNSLKETIGTMYCANNVSSTGRMLAFG